MRMVILLFYYVILLLLRSIIKKYSFLHKTNNIYSTDYEFYTMIEMVE